MLNIPSALTTTQSIDGYTDEGQARKVAMHKEGAKFLKKLAETLELKPGSFDIRSNLGGIAVSGEVTLHADRLYVQISESFSRSGLQMLYRDCTSRKDYTGGRNRFVELQELKDPDRKQAFLKECRQMVATATVD